MDAQRFPEHQAAYTPRPARRAVKSLGREKAVLGAGVLAAAVAGWFSWSPRPAAEPEAAPAARVEPTPAPAPVASVRAEEKAVFEAPPVAAPLPVVDHGPVSARDWAAAKVAAAWAWPERVETIDPVGFKTPTVKARKSAALGPARRLAAWDPAAPEGRRVQYAVAGDDGREKRLYEEDLKSAPPAANQAKPSGGLTTALSKLDEYAADVGRGVKYFVAAAVPIAIAKPVAAPAVAHAAAAPASRPHVAARTRFTGGGYRGGYAAAPQNGATISQAAAPGLPAAVQAAMISMPAAAPQAAAAPQVVATRGVLASPFRGKVVYNQTGPGGVVLGQDGNWAAFSETHYNLLAHDESKPFGSRNTWDTEFLNGGQVVAHEIWQASPLVFDLAGKGPQTSAGTVLFDIDGKGRKDSQQWINELAPGTGLLVFDGDGSGKPGENGTELFGDRTKLDGRSFANGFEALRALVEKAVAEKVLEARALDDGRLGESDLAALEKAYGLKMKVGGFNKPAVSLPKAGVKAIALSRGPITRVRDFDARGNDVMLQDGAVFLRADGSSGVYGDAWLVSKRASMLSQDRRVDDLVAK